MSDLERHIVTWCLTALALALVGAIARREKAERSDDAVVFRRPIAFRVFAAVMGTITATGSALAVAFWHVEMSRLHAYGLVVLAVFSAWLMLHLLRYSVILTGEGCCINGIFRSTRLDWSKIARVDEDGNLRITLTDGRRVEICPPLVELEDLAEELRRRSGCDRGSGLPAGDKQLGSAPAPKQK